MADSRESQAGMAVLIGGLGAAVALGIFLSLALTAKSQEPGLIPTFTPPAGLPVVTIPSLRPPDVPTGGEPTASEMVNALRFEVGNAFAHLRVAVGDLSQCPRPCAMSIGLSNIVEGLQARCEKVDPKSFRDRPAYRPQVHEGLIATFEATCNSLARGAIELGPPRDSQNWRNLADQISKQLAAALDAAPTPVPVGDHH